MIEIIASSFCYLKMLGVVVFCLDIWTHNLLFNPIACSSPSFWTHLPDRNLRTSNLLDSDTFSKFISNTFNYIVHKNY